MFRKRHIKNSPFLKSGNPLCMTNAFVLVNQTFLTDSLYLPFFLSCATHGATKEWIESKGGTKLVHFTLYFTELSQKFISIVVLPYCFVEMFEYVFKILLLAFMTVTLFLSSVCCAYLLCISVCCLCCEVLPCISN